MWYTPKVTTAPTAEPVSTVDAKRHLNVLHEDDDTLIDSYIASAREHVEKYCNVLVSVQDIEARCDDWPDLGSFPVGPLEDVASIEYVDTAGAPAVVPTTVYEQRDNSVVLKYGQAWPPKQTGSLITADFTAGMASIPPALRQAILLRVEDFYEKRGTTADGDWSSFDSILANFRFY